MDEAMIRRWTEMVRPNDTVWSLGDMFFGDEARSISIMSRLPGQKHLVYGNHDKVIRKSERLRSMFASVQEYKQVNIDGESLYLFHYPIWEWDRIHRGAIHLHGHIHDRLSGVPGRILNVCMDSPTLSDCAYGLYRAQDVIKEALKLPIRTHHGD